MRALMVRKRVLRWEAALALLAREGLLVKMRRFVLPKFRFFAEHLLTYGAGAVAEVGVRVGVAIEFALVFGRLLVVATRPAAS